MILLDGNLVSKVKLEELSLFIKSNNLLPSLCIIQIGENETSTRYIKNKIKKANEININSVWQKFEDNVNEEDVINYINQNHDKYDGLIVQLPLPKHLNKQKILDTIPLEKDVDGLSTKNMENFYKNNDNYFIPATAKAIETLLNFYKIDLIDKNIVVIGESNLVGKPTKHLLSKYSKNISSRNKRTGIYKSEEADILIVAAGYPLLIKEKDVKFDSVVVDVGINVCENNKIVGDVDFNNIKNKTKAISPVPGGVGPLTIIGLLENVIISCARKNNL